jgi:hypothetical protein
MSKELPYFRFHVAEWLNDDISFQSYEVKGVFIDVCAFYWFRDCDVNKELLSKRFSTVTTVLNTLFKDRLIKIEANGQITIKFLDEQYETLSKLRSDRQKAGKKGGKRKASKAKAALRQNSSYKDKDKDKDKDIIPTFDEFEKYALEQPAYKPQMKDQLLTRYNAWKANGWKDYKDNPIKKWKVKLIYTIPHFTVEETQSTLSFDYNPDA